MSIPVFSVHAVIAWLETQAPETEYDFYDCAGDCLVARYGLAMGLGNGWHDLHNGAFNKNGVTDCVARPSPFNYGAALARAKEMAEATP